MAKDPLTTALNNWSRRTSVAASSGYPLSAVTPIMQMDIAKVKAGSTGMTDAEAVQAITAASGNPDIQTPQRPAGLGSILGNVGSDVESIVTGLMGIPRFIQHLPSETANTLHENFGNPTASWDQSHGYEHLSGSGKGFLGTLAGEVRNEAHTPLGALIPGLTDIAGATTGAGRQGLTRHPVGSALDALPIASGVLKAAGVGVMAATTDESLAGLSNEELVAKSRTLYKQAINEKASIGPSAMESVSKGKPLQALSRATGASTQFTNIARHLGISSDIGEVSSKYFGQLAGVYKKVDDPQLVMSHLQDDTNFQSLHGNLQRGIENALQSWKPESWGMIDESLHPIIRQAMFRSGREAFVGWMQDSKLMASTDELYKQLDNIPQNLHVQYLNQWTQIKYGQLVPWAEREGDNAAYDIASNVPKQVHDALLGGRLAPKGLIHDLTADTAMPAKSALGKFYKGGINLWRKSILLTPRHIMHVGIGGLMFLTGDQGFAPYTLSHIKQAYEIADGSRILPEVVGKTADELKADQTYALGSGGTIGRIIKAIPNGADRLQLHISNMYKALAYVTRHGELLKSGADESAAMQGGIEAVRKVFTDFNAMTPVERTLVRQVFPFYGFTKHLFQYLGQFPADHPFRAEVLSTIAEQETANWNSGLPYMYQNLFFLGHPDANGNVKTIDVRAMNPFRSFFNDFSLTGVAMGLNPVLGGLLESFGINRLKGAPDLYPNMVYNPQTGGLQATRPSIWGKIPDTFFPQMSLLESFTGLNDQYKSLKQQDPAAFKQTLLSNFGIVGVPINQNVSQIRGRAGVNRYKDAQAAVSKALLSGDFSAVRSFNLVPYQGQLISPSLLESWYKQEQQQLSGKVQTTGATLKSLIPKKRVVRKGLNLPQYSGSTV